MRRIQIAAVFFFWGIFALHVYPSYGEQFSVGGNPLNTMGYITQGAAIGIGGEHYDTESGLQSLLTNIFIEGDYKLNDDVKLYLSSMLTVDWIYDIKSDDSTWNEKLFNKSSDRLYIDDEYWQILKEAYINWTPSNWNFRVGKQIVAWGETDGFRLMDQINPLDQKRGFADVEFESTIIPTWLVKAEYYLADKPNWLQDLGFQFVFNPNVSWIANQDIRTGNDVGGIWAPNVVLGPGMRLGSASIDIDEPDSWSDEGYEYGFRIIGIAAGSIVTLNGFYGKDNDYVARSTGMTTSVASNGDLLIHPILQAYYPDFKFIGATFSRDITPLSASYLGGVAPVIRLECLYAFDSTFVNQISNEFEEKDEWRYAVGIDWKAKINWLNPRAYFIISPQFYHRKILDYPSQANALSGVENDNYMTTLMITTSYLHNKLSPSFFWMRDITNDANFFRYQIIYDYTYQWRFTLGATAFDGDEEGRGFEVFDHKDQIYFKISYKWG